MSRYRRVNIDGRSLYKTETRRVAASIVAGLLPGTLVQINANNEWVQAADTEGQRYVLEVGYHEGLTIRDAIPAGHSAVGNYLEPGREFAFLAEEGVYAKDAPLTLTATGTVEAGGDGVTLAFSQDDADIEDPDFIRGRVTFATRNPVEESGGGGGEG